MRAGGCVPEGWCGEGVSQAKPVTVLARWNSTRRGDWLKPAVASAMAVGMVIAVPAQ